MSCMQVCWSDLSQVCSSFQLFTSNIYLTSRIILVVMHQEDRLSCPIKKAIPLKVSCLGDLFCVGHMSFGWSNP